MVRSSPYTTTLEHFKDLQEAKDEVEAKEIEEKLEQLLLNSYLRPTLVDLLESVSCETPAARRKDLVDQILGCRSGPKFIDGVARWAELGNAENSEKSEGKEESEAAEALNEAKPSTTSDGLEVPVAEGDEQEEPPSLNDEGQALQPFDFSTQARREFTPCFEMEVALGEPGALIAVEQLAVITDRFEEILRRLGYGPMSGALRVNENGLMVFVFAAAPQGGDVLTGISRRGDGFSAASSRPVFRRNRR